MANIELAKAYVTIVPSLEGAQQTISSELTGASVSAGAEAGEQAGSSFNSGFGTAVKAVGGAIAGATAAVAGAIAAGTSALVGFTREGASYADEVLTMSTNTHIATDELQAYMYAAELVDVSVETMTSSMARNVRSMSSAASGTGAVAEAYEALGVSVTDADGNLRDSQEVYWELIDSLGEVDDYTQRDALAMQIFGRSAQDLNSLIAVGSEGMAEYASQAEAAGAILSEDTLGAFGEFDDVMQQVDSGVSAAKNALGTVLLPVLTELGGEGVGLLGQFTTGILEANGNIDQIAVVIENLIPQVTALISQFIPTIVSLGGTIITSLISAILSNLPAILSTAGDVLRSLGEGIISVLPTLAPIAAELIVSLVRFIVDNLPTVIESAIEIILAIVTGLTDALPELIPACVAAILQICEALLAPDMLAQLLSAALEICIALGEGLINSIPEITSRVPEIITNILSAFAPLGTDLAANALTWMSDMIGNMVQGITNGLGRIADAAASIGSTIASYIGFSEPELGPLSNFHTYAPDMIDLFCEGIDDSTPELEATLNRTLSLPAVSAQETVTSDFSNDNANEGGDIVIPVYIGQERLDTIMLRSSQVATYRRGS